MGDPSFDLDDLVSNNNFDFISSLHHSHDTSDHPFNLDDIGSPYIHSSFKTEYIDPSSYSTRFSNISNLSIFSLNIQSLPSKFVELSDLIILLSKSNCNPDIICLQEIWQIPDPTSFNLPGYQPLIYSCRTGTQGGGVAIYLKNGISFKKLANISTFIDKLFESIFLEISLSNGKKITIGSIYRSNSQYSNLTQNDQFTQFNEILLNTLSSIDPSHPTYILGDFNLDAIKYNHNHQVTSYIDTLFATGFIQSITKPTRCTSHSATLIDHSITNVTQTNYSNFILTCKISDHFPFITFTDSSPIKNKKLTHTFSDFSLENIVNFKNNLSSLSWHDITSENCPEKAYNLFNDQFTLLHNLHFSPKTVKFNINYHRLEPWMSGGLLISRSTKLKLATLAAKKPSLINIANYKNYRNIYNTLLRSAKKLHFYKAIENNSSNLKKTWSILKLALNMPKPSNSISALLINNSLITDPISIANHFNNYFTNIANKIAEEIHPFPLPPTPAPIHDPDPDLPKFDFSSQPISEDEISNCIKSLEDKRTPDMSGISTSLLKKVYPSILLPLKHIFSQSFATGLVPSKFKIAKVIPLYKSGDCLDMSNYRPISLLSTFSKILEKLVHTRLYDYLDSNNLISQNQFGFRPNHSTTHPMSLLLNKLSSALNAKKHSIVIFCDLKKAFDTCNHELLLKKLSSLGINGTELLWFKNYLTDRHQFVSCSNSDSLLLTILTGVPQGSILGPLLFLIYINDLPNCNLLFSLLFADDTALTASADTYEELFTTVNAELHKLCTFFRINKLSLHPDKTKYLLIPFNNSLPPANLNLFLNNNNPNENNPLLTSKLSRVLPTDNTPAIKYLGVYFDPNLNFKFHINHISKKLSSSLFALRRVSNILPQHSLKTLYYSLFHCHLIYAIEIWSSAAPSLLKPLYTKQKAAIRLISLQPYNSHTEPLFKTSNILPLPQLVTYFKVKFMHSYIYNTAPSAFSNTWPTSLEHRTLPLAPIRGYNLRNDNELFIPPSRLKSLSTFPLYSFPTLWNSLPDYIKSIPTNLLFKSNLKSHFISALSSTPNCSRLFCPSCSATVVAS